MITGIREVKDSARGQVSRSAAEVYEEFFLPALFQEWPARVMASAGLRAGQRVLDVACGTGVLSRAVADRVGPSGSVVGLDVNAGMLDVAARKAPHIEWRAGRAEELPFEDEAFDAVVSQFGLMFFDDRAVAAEEMARVLRRGGRLAVAVWDRLERSPGYAAVTKLLQRLFGDSVASAMRAPFSLGDRSTLRSLFESEDLENLRITTERGEARFPSIQSWMFTDVRGWTLAEVLNDEQYENLVAEAEKELQIFVARDGSVRFDSPAHIVSARRRL
jgi:ubiquinone/menaquinone biosynthesis C-methylase UbiE